MHRRHTTGHAPSGRHFLVEVLALKSSFKNHNGAPSRRQIIFWAFWAKTKDFLAFFSRR